MSIRIAVAAACAIIVCMPSPTRAATGADSPFPNRPVRLLVPSTPSGSTDITARVMAQRLGDRWGQTVVVDNRAGATGLIALEILARAAPDGYTLIMLNPGYVLTGELSGKLSFKRGGDFTPIARSATNPLLLVLYPGVPAKSIKELVEFARAKPHHLNYASSGTGGMSHLAPALFASMAEIEMTHVPYKGSASALTDLVSGRVQLSLTSVAAAVPHVQAGRLRALAITGETRLPIIPEVPTFAEAGYPRYKVAVWLGLFAPARMPALLVARLNADLNWAVREPGVANRLASQGIDVAAALSPAQFADYIATDLVAWNEALKAAGMR